MQELYMALFGWCSNDLELLFSLFMFMFIVCSFLNFMMDLVKDTKGMM